MALSLKITAANKAENRTGGDNVRRVWSFLGEDWLEGRDLEAESFADSPVVHNQFVVDSKNSNDPPLAGSTSDFRHSLRHTESPAL